MDLAFLLLALLMLGPVFYELWKLYQLGQSQNEWGFLTEEEEEQRRTHIRWFVMWCGVSMCFSLLSAKHL